jgi:hypothetical protein
VAVSVTVLSAPFPRGASALWADAALAPTDVAANSIKTVAPSVVIDFFITFYS